MDYSTIVKTILIANGAYDITCAISILWLHSYPVFKQIALLHPKMISYKADVAQKGNDSIVRRLLAYWLFICGFVRLMAGIHLMDTTLVKLALLTYIFECITVEYEHFAFHSMIPWKAHFVSIFSGLLAVIIIRLIF